jgi:CHAT domain-containing protein
MRSFYGLLSGSDPAAALAGGQRRLPADPAHAHPYHWAAFVVVGAARRGLE